jgi:hypothetical protein
VAATYTYLICDLLTDEPICFLPFKGVSFDHRINQAGVFQGQVPIVNRTLSEFVNRVIPRDTADLTAGPGRLVCHVLRQAPGMPQDMWGSYWLWYGKVAQSRRGAPTAELRGMTLDGYLGHVEIQSDLSYSATDTVQIARNLITHAQSLPHANIGLTLQSGNRGATRDYEVKAEEAAKYGERLADVANADNGFEHRVDTYISGATRVRAWTWGNPLGGITPIEQYEQPGNVLEWAEEVDASRGATRWRARGDSINNDLTSSNTPLITTPVEATDYLNAGWPRTDKTVSYPGVKELSTLTDYATYWAVRAAGNVRIHSATVRLPDNPRLTPHDLGDYARFRLVNLRYPLVNGVASFVHSWRVVGMQVKPPERGGQEEAQLIFEEAIPS